MPLTYWNQLRSITHFVEAMTSSDSMRDGREKNVGDLLNLARNQNFGKKRKNFPPWFRQHHIENEGLQLKPPPGNFQTRSSAQTTKAWSSLV